MEYGPKFMWPSQNILTLEKLTKIRSFLDLYPPTSSYQRTYLVCEQLIWFYKRQLFPTLWLLGIQLYSRIRNLCQSHFWRHYECERKIMSSFLFTLFFFAFSWVPLLFRYTTLFSAKKVSLYSKLTDLHLQDFIRIKIKVPDSFKSNLVEKKV